ncbi:long-chain-alcohol oxidase FAO4A [Cornus florida]|uniref:long-chain-alcohol oxidase FAO4A n=1 Tax=Cornus florida TaxID=4283 RepID=UPI00289A7356|nr:long-chain-alcohol oxidase FAO4A [Cornus florida]
MELPNCADSSCSSSTVGFEIFMNGKQVADHASNIELGSPVVDTQRLLKGGGDREHVYMKSLSSAQMDSLIALCDTFLPSINLSNHTTTIHHHDPILQFYQTSASMARTPQRVEEMISGRLTHPKLVLMRLALWLLATWIGTFIICGRRSLTSQFPYFRRFSQLPLHNREDILRSLSLSYFYLNRMLFLGLKYLTLLVFFTQVNEKNENQSWKAIGYCGPDPDFKTRCNFPKAQHQEELFGPLYKCLINLNYPRQLVFETLTQSGFSISTPHGKKAKSNYYSLNPSFIIKCDAVVVGSGSGGGVVAGVLAKAGYKVLVLEKGQYTARSNLSLLEGQTLDQMYLGNGLLATDDMGVVVLAGSTVGGGSTINWSASIRTPEHVLREWSNHYELELFQSRLYKEALDGVCDRMGVQSGIDKEGFNNAVLRRGCQELGYPVNTIPRNSPPDHYCGWCCLGCKDGRKKGTAETWLVDMMDSGNGVILPESEAIQVLHKRKKGRARGTATGVAFEFHCQGAKEICIVESKVTIVACGALGTPPLLKRSHLKNPNIGENLHLHPVTMAWGYFPDTALSSTWPEAEKTSYEGGIMTAMSTVVGNYNTSGYGAVIQTPALHPGMFSVLMPWVSGIEIKTRMCKFSRTAHIFALARDKGSGEIVSPSKISYRMDTIDEENLKRGLEKILRILAAAGADEIGTHHCKGKTLKVKQVSSHEFERFVKEESSRALRDLSTPICSAHQMGSCRMGVDSKGSAVNQMGETWEVEGLYVADSSVFPTALGVNPMVTVQAIAYCTAQSVLQVLRRKKVTHYAK